ncbi:MAG: sulfate ABC transporter substrate-binding protein [Planctomycetes bacterium]|nr:sulfate ABC transporter substrate-binding protein [Planctomycetota bacterium]
MRFPSALLFLSIFLAGCSSGTSGESTDSGLRTESETVELLNVSYDPTRELWKDLNAAFAESYQQETGNVVTIKQSHGGSSSQARAVVDGLDADVVSLALWLDTDQIRQKNLIKDDWEERLPNRSLPYTSTIVFVVRQGNPKQIYDWSDLSKPGVQIITPNPKTSGNGKLAFMAAWGSVIVGGGTEDQARKFVTRLYKQVPVLDTGARGATTTFSQKEIGDVHLTWENEAHLEVQEAKGALELVYPSVSILAEPHVAVVDANVDRKHTRIAAEAYLKFLYTAQGQEIIARHFYRPADAETLAKHAKQFPDVSLFPITRLAASWNEAQARFFSDGAIFDTIYQSK